MGSRAARSRADGLLGGPTSVLVPVVAIPSVPRYREQGLPGVPDQCWLAEPALDRLTEVAEMLAAQGFGLCIWDAWRSGVTQQALADRYVRELVEQGVPRVEAEAGINTFVASPDGPYPHGTGGAVDLTLTRDGAPVDCGTGFDDFSERAHRDWFAQNPPSDAITSEQFANRRLLDEAMEAAGFVGLASEWWHFEWGTRLWASLTGNEAVLVDRLDPV